MIEKIFLQLLNMSFTSSVVILFVLVLRLFLRKVPTIYSYALWAVVLFRLLCPFSFESVLSLLPTKANPISQDIVYMSMPEVDTGIAAMNQVINTSLQTSLPAASPEVSINPIQIWVGLGSWIWLIGVFCLIGYSMIALLRLSKRLTDSRHHSDNIYLCGKIDTAFVMGILCPRIYLPANLSEKEKEYILHHEETHIRRFDHIIKLLAFFALCLHWFNPLAWLAFFLSAKDMEMSCDEAVIKKLGNEVKKDYSASLLTLATGRRIVGGTPLAFGEGDTKSRVKNVLNYKKPAFWVVVICLVLVVGLVIGLMANPIQSPANPENAEIAKDIEELWQSRTNYVGDNSAVGNIISKLNFPEELTREGFQLYTDSPPYGLVLHFKTNTATEDFSMDTSNTMLFKKNALILFSLIENVDRIEFVLDYEEKVPSFAYTRSWAHLVMEQNDLFGRTETLEDFKKLIEEIPAAIGKEIEDGSSEFQGSQEPLTFFVKPDEPPEVMADAAAEIFRRTDGHKAIPPLMTMGTYDISRVWVRAAEPSPAEEAMNIVYHYVVQLDYTLTEAKDSPQENSTAEQSPRKNSFIRLLYVKELEYGGFEIVNVATAS